MITQGRFKETVPTVYSGHSVFQESLSELETVLHPLLSSGGRDDLHSEKMSSVDKAKLDCLSAFAVNSLVWVWMRTKGVNPKETEVKAELDRVKKTMAKLKEIQDKEKRQKVGTVL